MPSLSFNKIRLSATAAAQNILKGLTSFIFSGIKEATAFNKKGKSFTKNKLIN
jgi:hypothetical protein